LIIFRDLSNVEFIQHTGLSVEKEVDSVKKEIKKNTEAEGRRQLFK
jgi:hypothetical protein